ncbi:MAG: hypothetical protein C4293_04255 [Nitrospiraceae bacterium]
MNVIVHEAARAFDYPASDRSPHDGRGVLVFTFSLLVAYSNREAWELLGRVKRAENKEKPLREFPEEIVKFRQDVFGVLQACHETTTRLQFQVSREIRTSIPPILLHGIAIAQPQGSDHSYLCLLMRELKGDPRERHTTLP